MILICRNCVANIRINHEQPSFNSPQYLKFCPVCGTENTIIEYNADESWFVIAESLGIPVAATKELYELWDPRAAPNFCDWVKLEMEKFKKAKNAQTS